MKMLILTHNQTEELKAINARNARLNKALSPVKLEGEEWGLGADLLQDKDTWENWSEFLESLPEKEVE